MCIAKVIALFLICFGFIIFIKPCPDKNDKRNIIVKLLRKNGYDKNQNLSDFWFLNKHRIEAELYKIVGNEDIEKFDLQVRWESRIGKECRKSLSEFIIAKQKEVREKQDKFIKDNPEVMKSKNLEILVSALRERPVIDFNDFSFTFKDKTYNLKEFAATFPTSQIGGWSDLRGIDLSNIAIVNAILRNVSFNYANLNNAKFQSVKFENINFVKATLVKCRFEAGGELIKTSLSEADLSGAFLNGLDLNDVILATPFKFSKIGYFELVKVFFKQLFLGNYVKVYDFGKHSHTSFLCVGTTGLNYPNLRDLKEYINWYQNVFSKIENFKKLSFFEKVIFVYGLLTTKYWTSFFSLVVYSALLISFFGIIFFSLKSGFENQGNFNGFFDGIYFSFMNFTSLGPGISVIPNAVIIKILIMFESVLGYINLGTLIFLIGHRLGNIF